mgnify:CR=1 FL=1
MLYCEWHWCCRRKRCMACGLTWGWTAAARKSIGAAGPAAAAGHCHRRGPRMSAPPRRSRAVPAPLRPWQQLWLLLLCQGSRMRSTAVRRSIATTALPPSVAVRGLVDTAASLMQWHSSAQDPLRCPRLLLPNSTRSLQQPRTHNVQLKCSEVSKMITAMTLVTMHTGSR